MRNHKEETGRSLAGKWKHAFIYGLIFIGGRGLAYVFLYPLVFVYTCFPSVRKKSQSYVIRRFSPRCFTDFFKHTYLLNLTFARTLVDRAALGILGATAVTSTEEERELCRKLLSEQKGLILLSAHVGCWQMAVNLMQFLPGKKHVLYYRNPKDYDKTVSQHTGQQAPFDFINPAGPLGGTVEMMNALQRGEVLCAMGDRMFGPEKNALSVHFFKGKVSVPYSFYRIAAITGAPIVILFFPWLKRGMFASKTAAVLRIPDGGNQKEKYLPYAQQFMDELADFCIQYPYQFFNYFDLWSEENATNCRRN